MDPDPYYPFGTQVDVAVRPVGPGQEPRWMSGMILDTVFKNGRLLLQVLMVNGDEVEVDPALVKRVPAVSKIGS